MFHLVLYLIATQLIQLWLGQYNIFSCSMLYCHFVKSNFTLCFSFNFANILNSSFVRYSMFWKFSGISWNAIIRRNSTIYYFHSISHLARVKIQNCWHKNTKGQFLWKRHFDKKYSGDFLHTVWHGHGRAQSHTIQKCWYKKRCRHKKYSQEAHGMRPTRNNERWTSVAI